MSAKTVRSAGLNRPEVTPEWEEAAMTTKSMWTSLTGAMAIVALLGTSLVADDMRDRDQAGYRARSTTRPTTSSLSVRQQTPESSAMPGASTQQPTLTIRLPGLTPPAATAFEPGVGVSPPGAATQLPGLPTDPRRSSAGANLGQPVVTSAINPTVPRPFAPTAGVSIVPSPTSGATMQRNGYPAGTGVPGATAVVTPGYGYNTGATAAYGNPSPTSTIPVSPTALRALSGPSPASYAPASSQPGVAPAPAAVAEKPFSGYTPPPVYSPYMNLFRNDNDRGRINNYYSFVRPMQEQQRINYQTQNTIQSLQSTTRAQNSQLQQIDQRTQPPVPTSNPSFMNYQHYYPGLAR